MLAVHPADAASIFDANRARGRIALAAQCSGGRTRIAQLREEGSLRVRFPAHAPETEAILLNNAGGVAGGDRFEISVRAEEHASLVMTTAAAEKVYKSHGPAAAMDIRISLAQNARFAWLPQETIVFDGARLERTIAIDLAGSASLVFSEAIVLGRSAMGERLASGCLLDRWRVRRDGRLIYADGTRLEGDVAAITGTAASTGGAVAVATILMIPANDQMVARVRAGETRYRGEVGASSWNDLASVRLVAGDGACLRHDFAAVAAIMGVTLPRLWLN